MKFMTIVTTSNPEKAGPPPPALLQAIAELGMKAGKALQDNGAMATIGVVKVVGGELIVDGPYSEANQAVGGGFAVYDVENGEEAIEWTRKFLELHRQHWRAWEGAVTIRQMTSFSQ